METQVSLRHANPDEADDIQSVSRAIWHAAYDGILGETTVENVLDEWYAIERLQADIECSIFYAAELEGEIVGFANAGPHSTDEAATFELSRIYILPDHWNRGIGSRLLEAACGAVRDAGGNSLRLTVLAANDVGVGFYESHGFERREQVKIELDGEPYRGFVYATQL